ncbi:MAG: response regulator, partial [Candidatus Omnitrophica bacterium]|nr:response regulator [Candidatus Omnitrophota bacterium]
EPVEPIVEETKPAIPEPAKKVPAVVEQTEPAAIKEEPVEPIVEETKPAIPEPAKKVPAVVEQTEPAAIKEEPVEPIVPEEEDVIDPSTITVKGSLHPDVLRLIREISKVTDASQITKKMSDCNHPMVIEALDTKRREFSEETARQKIVENNREALRVETVLERLNNDFSVPLEADRMIVGEIKLFSGDSNEDIKKKALWLLNQHLKRNGNAKHFRKLEGDVADVNTWEDLRQRYGIRRILWDLRDPKLTMGEIKVLLEVAPTQERKKDEPSDGLMKERIIVQPPLSTVEDRAKKIAELRRVELLVSELEDAFAIEIERIKEILDQERSLEYPNLNVLEKAKKLLEFRQKMDERKNGNSNGGNNHGNGVLEPVMQPEPLPIAPKPAEIDDRVRGLLAFIKNATRSSQISHELLTDKSKIVRDAARAKQLELTQKENRERLSVFQDQDNRVNNLFNQTKEPPAVFQNQKGNVLDKEYDQEYFEVFGFPVETKGVSKGPQGDLALHGQALTALEINLSQIFQIMQGAGNLIFPFALFEDSPQAPSKSDMTLFISRLQENQQKCSLARKIVQETEKQLREMFLTLERIRASISNGLDEREDRKNDFSQFIKGIEDLFSRCQKVQEGCNVLRQLGQEREASVQEALLQSKNMAAVLRVRLVDLKEKKRDIEEKIFHINEELRRLATRRVMFSHQEKSLIGQQERLLSQTGEQQSLAEKSCRRIAALEETIARAQKGNQEAGDLASETFEQIEKLAKAVTILNQKIDDLRAQQMKVMGLTEKIQTLWVEASAKEKTSREQAQEISAELDHLLQDMKEARDLHQKALGIIDALNNISKRAEEACTNRVFARHGFIVVPANYQDVVNPTYKSLTAEKYAQVSDILSKKIKFLARAFLALKTLVKNQKSLVDALSLSQKRLNSLAIFLRALDAELEGARVENAICQGNVEQQKESIVANERQAKGNVFAMEKHVKQIIARLQLSNLFSEEELQGLNKLFMEKNYVAFLSQSQEYSDSVSQRIKDNSRRLALIQKKQELDKELEIISHQFTTSFQEAMGISDQLMEQHRQFMKKIVERGNGNGGTQNNDNDKPLVLLCEQRKITERRDSLVRERNIILEKIKAIDNQLSEMDASEVGVEKGVLSAIRNFAQGSEWMIAYQQDAQKAQKTLQEKTRVADRAYDRLVLQQKRWEGLQSIKRREDLRYQGNKKAQEQLIENVKVARQGIAELLKDISDLKALADGFARDYQIIAKTSQVDEARDQDLYQQGTDLQGILIETQQKAQKDMEQIEQGLILDDSQKTQNVKTLKDTLRIIKGRITRTLKAKNEKEAKIRYLLAKAQDISENQQRTQLGAQSLQGNVLYLQDLLREARDFLSGHEPSIQELSQKIIDIQGQLRQTEDAKASQKKDLREFQKEKDAQSKQIEQWSGILDELKFVKDFIPSIESVVAGASSSLIDPAFIFLGIPLNEPWYPNAFHFTVLAVFGITMFWVIYIGVRYALIVWGTPEERFAKLNYILKQWDKRDVKKYNRWNIFSTTFNGMIKKLLKRAYVRFLDKEVNQQGAAADQSAVIGSKKDEKKLIVGLSFPLAKQTADINYAIKQANPSRRGKPKTAPAIFFMPIAVYTLPGNQINGFAQEIAQEIRARLNGVAAIACDMEGPYVLTDGRIVFRMSLGADDGLLRFMLAILPDTKKNAVLLHENTITVADISTMTSEEKARIGNGFQDKNPGYQRSAQTDAYVVLQLVKVGPRKTVKPKVLIAEPLTPDVPVNFKDVFGKKWSGGEFFDLSDRHSVEDGHLCRGRHIGGVTKFKQTSSSLVARVSSVLLTGSAKVSMDYKWRVFIPIEFSQGLSGQTQIKLAIHPDGFLTSKAEGSNFVTCFYNQERKRISLPQEIRDYWEVDDPAVLDLVVVGAGRYFELWKQAEWTKYRAQHREDIAVVDHFLSSRFLQDETEERVYPAKLDGKYRLYLPAGFQRQARVYCDGFQVDEIRPGDAVILYATLGGEARVCDLGEFNTLILRMNMEFPLALRLENWNRIFYSSFMTALYEPMGKSGYLRLSFPKAFREMLGWTSFSGDRLQGCGKHFTVSPKKISSSLDFDRFSKNYKKPIASVSDEGAMASSERPYYFLADKQALASSAILFMTEVIENIKNKPCSSTLVDIILAFPKMLLSGSLIYRPFLFQLRKKARIYGLPLVLVEKRSIKIDSLPENNSPHQNVVISCFTSSVAGGEQLFLMRHSFSLVGSSALMKNRAAEVSRQTTSVIRKLGGMFKFLDYYEFGLPSASPDVLELCTDQQAFVTAASEVARQNRVFYQDIIALLQQKGVKLVRAPNGLSQDVVLIRFLCNLKDMPAFKKIPVILLPENTSRDIIIQAIQSILFGLTEQENIELYQSQTSVNKGLSITIQNKIHFGIDGASHKIVDRIIYFDRLLIAKLIEINEKEYAKSPELRSHHGLPHSLRLWKYIKEIVHEFGFDVDGKVLAAAVFLHDIGIVYQLKETRHGQVSAREAFSYLQDLGLSFEQIRETLQAINEHDDYTLKRKSLESQLLLWADIKDALGPLGVIRYLEIYRARGIPENEIVMKVILNMQKRIDGIANAMLKRQLEPLHEFSKGFFMHYQRVMKGRLISLTGKPIPPVKGKAQKNASSVLETEAQKVPLVTVDGEVTKWELEVFPAKKVLISDSHEGFKFLNQGFTLFGGIKIVVQPKIKIRIEAEILGKGGPLQQTLSLKNEKDKKVLQLTYRGKETFSPNFLSSRENDDGKNFGVDIEVKGGILDLNALIFNSAVKQFLDPKKMDYFSEIFKNPEDRQVHRFEIHNKGKQHRYIVVSSALVSNQALTSTPTVVCASSSSTINPNSTTNEIIAALERVFDIPKNNLKDNLVKFNATLFTASKACEIASARKIKEALPVLLRIVRCTALDMVGHSEVRSGCLAAIAQLDNTSAEIEKLMAEILSSGRKTTKDFPAIEAAAARALLSMNVAGYLPETLEALNQGAQSQNTLIRTPCRFALNKFLAEKLNAIYTTTKPVVADISLEAFLPELNDRACCALGAGGLGFLTGETWGSYSQLKNVVAFGVMPLYELDKQDQQIDWASEENIYPVILQDGKPFSIGVNFNFRTHKAHIFWVNRGGTLVFLIRCPAIFSRLYRGGDEQTRYYGFLARSFVELMKKLGISPALTRLNEPQLVFVATAMENDRAWFKDNGNGHKSLFAQTKIVMTTHTPEAAALPYWERNHICQVVGEDLIRWEIVLDGKDGHLVNAAVGLARLADVINGVADEHAEVTKIAVLPEFKNKVIGIVNGSDPWLWSCDDLRALLVEKGVDHITGEDIFKMRHQQKFILNDYLQDQFDFNFIDPARPLIGLIRRLVPYKEQGILIPGYQQEWDKFRHKKYIEWVTGDRGRFYETPWDKDFPLKQGLGANLLVGGDTYYDDGATWVRLFKEMAEDPALKRKFLFVEKSGIEVMKKVVNATDEWVSMPRCTREACGTSDQRVALTGGYNIATATGGPLEYIIHRVNGWLMDPFAGWDLTRVVRGFDYQDPWFVEEYQKKTQILLGRYLEEAMMIYYRYVEEGDTQWTDGLKACMVESYKKVSIHVMARKYEALFLNTINGQGIAGYEKDLEKLMSSSSIDLAVRTLKNRFGIVVDLKKQTINGLSKEEFLVSHGLYADCALVEYYQIQDEARGFGEKVRWYWLKSTSLHQIREYIRGIAHRFDAMEKTLEHLNRCGTCKLGELTHVFQWAAGLDYYTEHRRKRQMTKKLLFGCIDVRDLKIEDLSIFAAVHANGQFISDPWAWSWMLVPGQAPPQEYFNHANKISLDQYFPSSDVQLSLIFQEQILNLNETLKRELSIYTLLPELMQEFTRMRYELLISPALQIIEPSGKRSWMSFMQAAARQLERNGIVACRIQSVNIGHSFLFAPHSKDIDIQVVLDGEYEDQELKDPFKVWFVDPQGERTLDCEVWCVGRQSITPAWQASRYCKLLPIIGVNIFSIASREISDEFQKTALKYFRSRVAHYAAKENWRKALHQAINFLDTRIAFGLKQERDQEYLLQTATWRFTNHYDSFKIAEIVHYIVGKNSSALLNELQDFLSVSEKNRTFPNQQVKNIFISSGLLCLQEIKNILMSRNLSLDHMDRYIAIVDLGFMMKDIVLRTAKDHSWPLVVLFSGPTGTLKSTLIEALSQLFSLQEMGYVVIDEAKGKDSFSIQALSRPFDVVMMKEKHQKEKIIFIETATFLPSRGQLIHLFVHTKGSLSCRQQRITQGSGSYEYAQSRTSVSELSQDELLSYERKPDLTINTDFIDGNTLKTDVLIRLLFLGFLNREEKSFDKDVRYLKPPEGFQEHYYCSFIGPISWWVKMGKSALFVFCYFVKFLRSSASSLSTIQDDLDLFLTIEGKGSGRRNDLTRDQEIIERMITRGEEAVNGLISVAREECRASLRAKSLVLLKEIHHRCPCDRILNVLVDAATSDPSLLVRSLLVRSLLVDIVKKNAHLEPIIADATKNVNLNPWPNDRPQVIRILDVGCYFGEATQGIAMYYRDTRDFQDLVVVGVDCSYVALIEAERKRTDPDIIFVFADIRRESLGPADIIFSMNLLIDWQEAKGHALGLLRQSRQGSQLFYTPSNYCNQDVFFKFSFALKEAYPGIVVNTFSSFRDLFGDSQAREPFDSCWGEGDWWLKAVVSSGLSLEGYEKFTGIRVTAKRGENQKIVQISLQRKIFPGGENVVRFVQPKLIKDARIRVEASIGSCRDLTILVWVLDGLNEYKSLSCELVLRISAEERFSQKHTINPLWQDFLLLFCETILIVTPEEAFVVKKSSQVLLDNPKKKSKALLSRIVYQHTRLAKDALEAGRLSDLPVDQVLIDRDHPCPLFWDVSLPSIDLQNQVMLLHSTENDKDIAELWLMLVAFRQAGWQAPDLFDLYKGYSRQDKVFNEGEVVSAWASLKAVSPWIRFHLALNLHYGHHSGWVDFAGFKIYNINAFVILAERLFDLAFEGKSKREITQDLKSHPLLILAPDDGALVYVKEAVYFLKKYIRRCYKIQTSLIVYGYMDKKRLSRTDVHIPKKVLKENGYLLKEVNNVPVSALRVFLLDDETAFGSTLLKALWVLVKGLGIVWRLTSVAVVHGKLTQGQAPFNTGWTDQELKTASYPKEECIDYLKERMPPYLFLTTTSVSLPREIPWEKTVSVGPTVSHAIWLIQHQFKSRGANDQLMQISSGVVPALNKKGIFGYKKDLEKFLRCGDKKDGQLFYLYQWEDFPIFVVNANGQFISAPWAWSWMLEPGQAPPQEYFDHANKISLSQYRPSPSQQLNFDFSNFPFVSEKTNNSPPDRACSSIELFKLLRDPDLMIKDFETGEILKIIPEFVDLRAFFPVSGGHRTFSLYSRTLKSFRILRKRINRGQWAYSPEDLQVIMAALLFRDLGNSKAVAEKCRGDVRIAWEGDERRIEKIHQTIRPFYERISNKFNSFLQYLKHPYFSADIGEKYLKGILNKKQLLLFKYCVWWHSILGEYANYGCAKDLTPTSKFIKETKDVARKTDMSVEVLLAMLYRVQLMDALSVTETKEEGVTDGFLTELETIFRRLKKGFESNDFREFFNYLRDVRKEQGQINQEFLALVNAVIEKKGLCDLDILVPAFLIAKRSHFGQRRKQKKMDVVWHNVQFKRKPYVIHPIEVARFLVDVFDVTDERKLTIALLHDVPENTDVSLSVLEKIYGRKVGQWIFHRLDIVNKYMATSFVFDYRERKKDDVLHSYIMYLIRILVKGNHFDHVLKAADVVINFSGLSGLSIDFRIATVQKTWVFVKLFMESSRLRKETRKKILFYFRKGILDIFSDEEIKENPNVAELKEAFEGRVYYYENHFFPKRSACRKDSVRAMYNFWKNINGKTTKLYVPLFKTLPFFKKICAINAINMLTFLPLEVGREIVGALIPHYFVSLMPLHERRNIKGDIEIRWKDGDKDSDKSTLFIIGRRIFIGHVIKYFWFKTLPARQWLLVETPLKHCVLVWYFLKNSFVGMGKKFPRNKTQEPLERSAPFFKASLVSGTPKKTSSSAIGVITGAVALIGFLFAARAFRDLIGARRVRLEGVPESLWLIRFYNKLSLKDDLRLNLFLGQSTFDKEFDWQIGRRPGSIFIKAGFGLRKEVVGLAKIDLYPREYRFLSSWFSEQSVSMPCACLSYLETLRLHRKKGIAKELIKEAVRISQESGFCGVCVVNVPKRFIPRYKKLGFDIVNPGKVIVGMLLSEEKAQELLATSSSSSALLSILVVDDEEWSRNMAALFSEQLGYRAYKAESYDQALAILMTTPEVDVLLSDVDMPGQNGIALAKHVQKAFPSVMIIMMSAWLGEDRKRELAELRLPFLDKPLSLEDLDKAINEEKRSSSVLPSNQDEKMQAMMKKMAGNQEVGQGLILGLAPSTHLLTPKGVGGQSLSCANSNYQNFEIFRGNFVACLNEWEKFFKQAMNFQENRQHLEAVDIYQNQCVRLANKLQGIVDDFGGLEELEKFLLLKAEELRVAVQHMIAAVQEVAINSYGMLADCQEELGFLPEALKNYLIVEHVSEFNFAVPMRIGNFYSLQGDKKLADVYYQKAIDVLLKSECQIQEPYFSKFMAGVLFYYAITKESPEDFVRVAGQIITTSESFADVFFGVALDDFAKELLRIFEEADSPRAKEGSLRHINKAQIALEAFQEALLTDAQYVAIVVIRTRIFRKTGDLEKAQALVQREIDSWTGETQGLTSFYRSLMLIVNDQSKNTSDPFVKESFEAKALALLKEIYRRDPKDLNIAHDLSWNLILLGEVEDFKESENVLNNARRSHSGVSFLDLFTQMWTGIYLGIIYRKIGKPKDSLWILEKSMGLAPRLVSMNQANKSSKEFWAGNVKRLNVVAFYNVALYYHEGKNRNVKKAVVALKGARNFIQKFENPSDVLEAYHVYDLLVSLTLKEDFPEKEDLAEQYFDEARRFFEEKLDPPFLCLGAEIYKEKGRYQEAEDLLFEAIAKDKNNASWILIQFSLGALYIKSKDFNRAKDIGLEIAREFPGTLDGYSILAHAYYGLKDFGLSCQHCKEALSLSGEDMLTTHSLYFLLALLYLSRPDLAVTDNSSPREFFDKIDPAQFSVEDVLEGIEDDARVVRINFVRMLSELLSERLEGIEAKSREIATLRKFSAKGKEKQEIVVKISTLTGQIKTDTKMFDFYFSLFLGIMKGLVSEFSFVVDPKTDPVALCRAMVKFARGTIETKLEEELRAQERERETQMRAQTLEQELESLVKKALEDGTWDNWVAALDIVEELEVVAPKSDVLRKFAQQVKNESYVAGLLEDIERILVAEPAFYDLDSVIRLANQILGIRNNHLEALRVRGVARFLKKAMEGVFFQADRCIREQDTKEQLSLLQRDAALAYVAKQNEISNLFATLQSNQGHHLSERIQLSTLYEELWMFPQAVTHLEKVLSVNKVSVEALVRLANLYYERYPYLAEDETVLLNKAFAYAVTAVKTKPSLLMFGSLPRKFTKVIKKLQSEGYDFDTMLKVRLEWPSSEKQTDASPIQGASSALEVSRASSSENVSRASAPTDPKILDFLPQLVDAKRKLSAKEGAAAWGGVDEIFNLFYQFIQKSKFKGSVSALKLLTLDYAKELCETLAKIEPTVLTDRNKIIQKIIQAFLAIDKSNFQDSWKSLVRVIADCANQKNKDLGTFCFSTALDLFYTLAQKRDVEDFKTKMSWVKKEVRSLDDIVVLAIGVNLIDAFRATVASEMAGGRKKLLTDHQIFAIILELDITLHTDETIKEILEQDKDFHKRVLYADGKLAALYDQLGQVYLFIDQHVPQMVQKAGEVTNKALWLMPDHSSYLTHLIDIHLRQAGFLGHAADFTAAYAHCSEAVRLDGFVVKNEGQSQMPLINFYSMSLDVLNPDGA